MSCVCRVCTRSCVFVIECRVLAERITLNAQQSSWQGCKYSIKYLRRLSTIYSRCTLNEPVRASKIQMVRAHNTYTHTAHTPDGACMEYLLKITPASARRCATRCYACSERIDVVVAVTSFGTAAAYRLDLGHHRGVVVVTGTCLSSTHM